MKNKINLLLLSFLVLSALSFNSCKKETDLEKIGEKTSASSIDNVLSREQQYLDLLNSNPDIQYQWTKKTYKIPDILPMRFALSDKYYYYDMPDGYDVEVFRYIEDKAQVDYVITNKSALADFKANGAAYFEAAEFFKRYKSAPESTGVKRQRLTQELNAILKPGDRFEFSDNVPANASTFHSVQEFHTFLESPEKTESFDETPEQNPKRAIARYWIGVFGGVGIHNIIEKTDNIWNWVSLASQPFGVTLSWTWTQIGDPIIETTPTEIKVNVIGTVNYNVVIESFGTLYQQGFSLSLTINRKTGLVTYMKRDYIKK